MKTMWPGTRVKVFDHRLFVDDKSTPLSVTMKPATVVCWYGYESRFGRYSDLIDVVFDHRPDEVSHRHFSDGVLTGVFV
jgi:hypothetical protein